MLSSKAAKLARTRKMAAESVIKFQNPLAHAGEQINNESARTPQTPSLPNVVIGRLEGFENGLPMVNFPNNNQGKALRALTGVPLSQANTGREVILAFADGDPEKPVILNLLVDLRSDGIPTSSIDIQVDGERLLLTAQKEIVLRCGEASITLTAAGKVLLKGTYVLSRSSGYNKIKGAAVDIN
jgi:hypothetical protein